ncbi:DUF6911 family protein [Snodgrassella alvi]|uniref:DUF6911 family protein n=1 Tax=Snodgrassella alvi TaxID=1196083 RepID=UPI000C1E9754|nr:hypothetical protein [Snodgrassella alvi]PIT16488.1 hypothetical protein BGI33_03860 [Snodgrassella alvi]PIT18396.1 hypothetical protein BGI34_05230 [Snodgrassella alvi]
MDKVYLPRIENPTVEQMQQYLEILRTNNGFLSLWKQSKSKPTSPGMEITLYSDNHETDIQTYMVLLGEETEEGYDVRTFYNPAAPNNPEAPRGMTYMLGDCFAASSTVRNFAMVIHVFAEFLTTGDVSKNLLN